MRISRLLFIFVLLVLTPMAHLAAAPQYDNSYKAAPLEPNTETVDILWEAGTITPPWYKGRALASPGSTVRAVAVPNVSQPASSIVYNWYKDTKLIKRSTGKGANQVELPAPGTYSSYILSVELLDTQGRLLGRNGSKVVSTSPQVLLYKSSPLLGTLYNSALRARRGISTTLQDTEPTITAVPFYFTWPSSGELSYTWSVIGAVYDKPTPDSITLINSSGTIDVSLRVSNNTQLLQSARIKHSIKTPRTSTIDNLSGVDTAAADTPFNVVQ